MAFFDISDLPTLHRMQDAARRVTAMIHARACREFGLAFGSENSTSLDMCVLHNSIVAREQGKPWQEVDYSHMRRAAWLIEKSYEPSRLVNNWYRRKCGLPANY